MAVVEEEGEEEEEEECVEVDVEGACQRRSAGRSILRSTRTRRVCDPQHKHLRTKPNPQHDTNTEQYMQEQREERIARAYKRQRAEEHARDEQARAEAAGTTAGVRRSFYDSVFRGGVSEDNVLDELYGTPRPRTTAEEAAPPPRAKAPRRAPATEGEEREKAPRERPAAKGIVNSKATKAWKAEERRRIAEQEAERARKIAREKRQRQRREEHKLLAQRTRRGQPVMANVVTHLLKKLEKQAAAEQP